VTGQSADVQVRYYGIGFWLYQVTAFYAADGDAEAAGHFVESFKLLEK
jgi:hypothetical protein